MRYSTLASAVLLAAAAAPALAHPITIRATEDACMVEREFQDGLEERGYYDDLLSRDFEARSDKVPELRSHLKPKVLGVRRKKPTLRNPNKGTPGVTPPQHKYQIVDNPKAGGSGQGSGAHHRRREHDLDGELFERSFEIHELD